MKKRIFATCFVVALAFQSDFSFAGDATVKLQQTMSDLIEFKAIAQNEEGQWLSYTHENGDILKRLR